MRRPPLGQAVCRNSSRFALDAPSTIRSVDHSWVEHNGARLAVSAVGAGSGPPIVFVHAGVADRRSWFPVMEIAGRHRRCIAFDQRGFGDTTYDTSRFSGLDDLIAVLDQSGVDEAVVVGCSKGGQLAYEAALCIPERVAALVMIGSAPQGAGPAAVELPAAVGELFAAIEQAEDAGDLVHVNELEANVWLDGPLAPPGRVTGEARQLFLDMNAKALQAPATGDERPLRMGWSDL